MDTTIQGAQLALALAGALVLAWEHRLARRGRGGVARVLRNRLFAALGILGIAAFLNFGRLHDGRFIHIWDTYHYYVGSKYFPELGYDGLYDCTAVADADAGFRHDIATHLITDLHTNEQVTAFQILIHPESCLRRFTPARWAAFGHDVAWFRDRIDRGTWRSMLVDHGYNATPVWTATGYLLTNLAPASDLQIACLAALDPLLLAAALLLLGACFGWRVGALAAILLGTYFPSRFFWTGGAFLRFDWVFCAIAGLCALRRDRPLLGGAALAYAALLRLFPAAMFVGPALAAIAYRRATGTWCRDHLRLFAGAALAVALAAPPALIVAGPRVDGFVANTLKHADTPLTNHMGLPTLLSYRPDATVRRLYDAAPRNIWPRFKAVRRDAARQTRPVVIAVALAVLGLLWRGARPLRQAGQPRPEEPPREPVQPPVLTPATRPRSGPAPTLPLWRTAALSMLLIPVLLQLTCYYYVFVIAWAPLAERRPAVGAVLLGMCAASLIVVLGAMPGAAMDENFVVLSGVAVAGLGVAFVQSLHSRRGTDRVD